jgi:hypothetical protein
VEGCLPPKRPFSSPHCPVPSRPAHPSPPPSPPASPPFLPTPGNARESRICRDCVSIAAASSSSNSTLHAHHTTPSLAPRRAGWKDPYSGYVPAGPIVVRTAIVGVHFGF